jgi:LmbE family N-acetylglucosaminyl deacetylase
MNNSPTILGVFAHPDDESFGPGGTLARYAAQGANVHVIIATDGIAGSVEDGYQASHTSLAQDRAAELSDAAVELALTSIWSLPYRDSGMRGSPDNEHPDALIQQPIEDLVREISEYMVLLRPDVVITHDPFGGYGHPDHVRCCEVTTAAFHLLRGGEAPGSNGAVQNSPAAVARGANGFRPQKLYYTASNKRLLKIMVRIMPLLGQDPTAVGRNRDINLVEISRWKTPVHARIDVLPYLPRKDAASRAHISQYGGGPAYMRAMPRPLRNRLRGVEAFTRAYPAPQGKIETDLLAGLR